MSVIEKGGHDTPAGSRLTAAPRPSSIGNPASLGLFSFASTTFMLSLYNVSVRGTIDPTSLSAKFTISSI
jgi:succinate-acetate transporter protein